MTPQERADDILRRCWWRQEEHPGETRPQFNGLDEEIAAAIEAAVAEERDFWLPLMDRALGALADIALADDLTEASRRRKAKRIYDLIEPQVETRRPPA